MHCVIRRKVAGSSLDVVTGNFNYYNPSGRPMVLVSIQPVTGLSTRNISWVIKAADA
jgi:hypothetical protein